MFELHPQLEKDTFFVKDLQLCRVLLMNNSLYPWFILVPKKNNLIEIIDLLPEDQNLLMKEISIISKILKIKLNPDKINIAALGNIVSQLHIHIIARFKDDLTFPKPIWTDEKITTYNDNELRKMIDLI